MKVLDGLHGQRDLRAVRRRSRNHNVELIKTREPGARPEYSTVAALPPTYTFGVCVVRASSSADGPGAPSGAAGLTAPSPVRYTTMASFLRTGFAAVISEKSRTFCIAPMPYPRWLCVKIPGAVAASGASTAFDRVPLLRRPCNERQITPAFMVVGRLQQGVHRTKAEAYLRPLFAARNQDKAQYMPEAWRDSFLKQPRDLEVKEANHGLYGLNATYARPLWIVFAITGVVLLAACVNIAGLLLSQAERRQHETAVGLALGASRGQILGRESAAICVRYATRFVVRHLGIQPDSLLCPGRRNRQADAGRDRFWTDSPYIAVSRGHVCSHICAIRPGASGAGCAPGGCANTKARASDLGLGATVVTP